MLAGTRLARLRVRPVGAAIQCRDGIISSFVDRYVKQRNLAGTDEAGNKYWWRLETEPDGKEKLRRWVEYAGDPDGASVPPLWSAWLRATRHEPPTAEEQAAAAAAREATLARAAMLKEEERRRALRNSARQAPEPGGSGLLGK